MTDQPPNPSAFPHSCHDGMTLRDWFAGQALVEVASLIAVKQPETFNVVARIAYSLADAMLIERNRK